MRGALTLRRLRRPDLEKILGAIPAQWRDAAGLVLLHQDFQPARFDSYTKDSVCLVRELAFLRSVFSAAEFVFDALISGRCRDNTHSGYVDTIREVAAECRRRVSS